MGKIAIVVLSIPAMVISMMLTTVAATGLLVVEVKDAKEGTHLYLPVPLAIAQVAAAVAPQGRHALPAEPARQISKHAKLVRAVLDELDAVPDADLVRVHDHDEDVRIAKQGDRLVVHVQGRRENVDVAIPLACVREIVERAEAGSLTPADVVGALGRARLTKLVDVDSGD